MSDNQPLLKDMPPPYVPDESYANNPAPPPLPSQSGAASAGYPGAAAGSQPGGYPTGYSAGYSAGYPTTAPVVEYQYQTGYQTGYQTISTQPMPVIVAVALTFGELPQVMDCPVCHARIATRTEKVAGNMAYLSCGIMFLFGCWLCCFIPFCVDSMQDIVHRCPNCSSIVGRCQRLK